MMNKKAQSQIITTVLIILLVLAAIVIVWQVVRSTVDESAGEIAGQTDCLTLDLEITEPVTNLDANIDVERKVGTGDLQKIKVLIDDVEDVAGFDASALDELGSLTIALSGAVATGEEVSIAAIVGTGDDERLCNIADTATVVA